MCSEYTASSPQVDPEIYNGSHIDRSWQLVLWDEKVAALQQAIESKQHLRLLRIEQECARIRRPARKRGVERSVLRTVNSCPTGRCELLKDVAAIQDRFDWLQVDTNKSEVYCVVCVSRLSDDAPCSTKEPRWQLLSPRGRSVVPNVEAHSFSSVHAWAMTHRQLVDVRSMT